MDLFLLSYRIQQRRYHVPAELVAEAILLWHSRLDRVAPAGPTVRPEEPARGDGSEPRHRYAPS